MIMLKKFTDFTNERISNTKQNSDKVIVVPDEDVNSNIIKKPEIKKPEKNIEIKKPEIKKPEIKKPEIKKPEIKKPEKNIEIKKPKETLEKFEFIGKIANFPGNIKPSVSMVLLENNNVSKEKLHYIISEQTLNTLVVFKYNEKAEIKLTDFITNLMQYYMKNQQLKQTFSKIVVEGTENYSIIKNIPNILLGEKRIIQIINDDLIKLLK